MLKKSTNLTLAPTGVRDTLVPTGGADDRPSEISKTKQARDKRKTALDTEGQALQFLLRSFLGQVKNDVIGVKNVKMAAPENKGVFCQ